MRARSTIVLLLLLIGLGAYVYWVEYPKAQQEAKKKTLFEFSTDDVTEVSLVYPDREIVLKKSGDEWRLTKPVDVAADATAAKNLVNAIAECEVKRELTEAGTDLAQYGIDKPFVTVTVKLKNKELPAILVGKNTPVGFSTYVQRADDKKIFLTSSAFRSGMDKKVKDLRDKTIIAFTDTDVNRIDIQGSDKDLRLVKKDDVWTIEQPGPYAADAATIRSFLSTLRSIRAVDFPDDHPTDLSAYGLDHPRLKVTLYLGKDNAARSVLLGKETDKKELYVQESSRPTVYTVSDWVFRDVDKSLNDLRDKTVLAFDRDKISAVDVKRSDGTQFKLVRGDNKQWRAEGREGKPAETAISQFLGDLHDLKGYEIAADHPADLAPFGLDHPLLTLTVVGEDGKPIGTILLAEHQAEGAKKEYTAMREGGPTVFRVRDYLVTRLNKTPEAFVELPTPTPGGATPTAVAGAAAVNEPDLGSQEEADLGGSETGGAED
jgi:hypothetical protein